VPRSDNEPGKGAFWMIDSNYEHLFSDGIYRRRQRAIKLKQPGDEEAAEEKLHTTTAADRRAKQSLHLHVDDIAVR